MELPSDIVIAGDRIRAGRAFIGYKGGKLKKGLHYINPGSYFTVGRNADGSPYVRKKDPSERGSYGKPSGNPAVSLASAIGEYDRANGVIGSFEEFQTKNPGASLTGTDKATYESIRSELGILRREIQAYAKDAAKGIVDGVGKLASEAERAVRQEERGRKILGRVPYWKRPKPDKVNRKITDAWHQLRSEVEVDRSVSPTNAQASVGGVNYNINYAGGALKSIRVRLEKAGLLKDAEGDYMAGIDSKFVEHTEKIARLYARHQQTIANRGEAVEDKSVSKINKEREKRLKKHLKRIRQGKV